MNTKKTIAYTTTYTEEGKEVIKEIKEKVYCGKCAYYRIAGPYGETCPSCEIDCLHPKNWYRFVVEDYEEKKWDERARRSPSEINANNDCSWWEKRRLWNKYKRWLWLKCFL